MTLPEIPHLGNRDEVPGKVAAHNQVRTFRSIGEGGPTKAMKGGAKPKPKAKSKAAAVDIGGPEGGGTRVQVMLVIVVMSPDWFCP